MIGPALARRIDRLGRHAHAFHRFAHHPLCPAYRREVVAIGGGFYCKGCLLAATGLALGLAAALALPCLPRLTGWMLLGAWSAGLLALTRWRPAKFFSRFLPAALAAFLAGQGLRAGGWAGLGLAAAALILSAAFLRAYRHRGPHRAPCLVCPERIGPGVCSGYLRQMRRERAFQRLAGRWIRIGQGS